jgi:hypothetical protein
MIVYQERKIIAGEKSYLMYYTYVLFVILSGACVVHYEAHEGSATAVYHPALRALGDLRNDIKCFGVRRRR